MSSPDPEEYAPYDQYPVIGGFTCPLEGCDEPLFIHARLSVGIIDSHSGPAMTFGVKLFTDAVALHMVGHGASPVLYDNLDDYYEAHEEDQ
jgi:hypothetical protein